MISLAQNPPTKFKIFFYSKLHNATSHYGVWTALHLNLLPSYGWPKFAVEGQIMHFVKSFELGQKLGFWPIILATDMLASQSRAL